MTIDIEQSSTGLVIAFITASISFAVGSAWSNTFQAIFAKIQSPSHAVVSNLIYAICITVFGAYIVPRLLRFFKRFLIKDEGETKA